MARKKEINYLFEIKCFYEWLERNALSAAAIALWHGLMYLWNQSFWQNRFTPAIASISARTGLSKSTIVRARNELISAGLLKVRETKKGSASVYKLVQFCAKSDTIYKLNETKQNKTKQNETKQISPPTPRIRREGKKKMTEEEKKKEQLDAYRQGIEYLERTCEDEV